MSTYPNHILDSNVDFFISDSSLYLTFTYLTNLNIVTVNSKLNIPQQSSDKELEKRYAVMSKKSLLYSLCTLSGVTIERC